MRQAQDPSRVLLTISHPHGDVEVTMAEWFRIGPGPRQHVRPLSARSITGEPLSLSVIPFRYRNNAVSKLMIRLHIFQSPWGRPSGSADARRENFS
jgi:hypothetical protein